MTTLTLKINENSEKGKALLAFLKAFSKDNHQKDVELVEEPKSPYNPEFVAKIKQAEKEDGIELPSDKDIWEIIE